MKRMVDQCIDCGASTANALLGAWWCPSCDRERVHRVGEQLRRLAGAAPQTCDCLYCQRDRAAARDANGTP